MPFCHFSKISKSISWSKIKANTLLQIANNCKKIEYLKLTDIVISKLEFDTICKDISIPNLCYQNFTLQSVAGTDGIWRCIILQNTQDTRKIILYTSGRIYPLYAAIEEYEKIMKQ